MKIKVCGFTLAEVLITLGIIGIVAALTIPSLLQSAQEAEFKNKAKAVFSDISQAVNLAKLANGGTMDSGHVSSAQLLDLIKPHLKYSKSCVNAGPEGCLGATYKHLSGVDVPSNWNPGFSGVALNNGAGVEMMGLYYSSTCTFAYSATLKVCGAMHLDVNSAKQPNQYGKDMFILYVTKDRVVPAGAPGAYGMFADHVCPTYGQACLANVLNNVDY